MKSFRNSAGQRKTLLRDRRQVDSRGGMTIGTAGQAQVMLQEPGLYGASMVDPFTYRGARIPDMTSYPSVVYSAETEFTCVLGGGTGSNGFLNSDTTPAASLAKGFIIHLDSAPTAQPLSADGIKPEVSQRSSQTGNALTGGVAPLWPVNALFPNVGLRFRSARLVSAQVIVRFAGNDSNCQGTIAGFVVSPEDYIIGTDVQSRQFQSSQPLTNSFLSKQRTGYLGPLKDGIVLTYLPHDSGSFEYRPIPTGIAAFDLNGDISVGVTSENHGAFVISVEGAASNAAPFNVSVVCNYEAIAISTDSGDPSVAAAVNNADTSAGLLVAAQSGPVHSASMSDINARRRVANKLMK